MTTVRLAWGGTMKSVVRSLLDGRPDDRPALLVSYAYWDKFQAECTKEPRLRSRFRDYSLDSGAFTAANSGKPVDLARYIDFCQGLRDSDPQCVEIFSLDVIGDWRASARNAAIMVNAGVPCIPTFHVGEPTAALLEMADAFPKISIGGAVRWSLDKKLAWAEQVFARVWPKKIHGLGMTSERMLSRLPFHSVDSSDCFVAPVQYGVYKQFGKVRGIRGSAISTLRCEVEWYLKLERMLRDKHGRQLASLEARAA
jgi:hypothetical protein